VVILFLVLIEICGTKKPAGFNAGGLGCFRSLWPITSGHGSRRHGGPMMVVVTVMVAVLHLIKS
jgi:hypothetical protein